MKRLTATLVTSIATISLASAAASPGDTLSKAYLDATSHWLFGRTKLAERSLRQVAAQSVSTVEQASAKELLLDEFYFRPGKYRQYLHLADSLNFGANFYGTAKLLAQQPPLQINLTGDSLQLPFKLKNKAHVVVTVLMNGKPVRLAVDTGAQLTGISNRAAQKSGVKKLVDTEIENYNQKTVPAWLGLADSLR